MDGQQIKTVRLLVLLLIAALIVGCGGPAKTSKPKGELAPEIHLGTTIGSLAEVFSFDMTPVEGYSIVGGLNGTGSSECPPRIRKYLEKYILKQLPGHKNTGQLISSRNTAVVLVEAMMPAAVSKNQHFDVRVTALPSTQTTSLEGGELYGAELKRAGRFYTAIKVLAKAEGPVFIDTISTQAPNKRVGYILAGGTVLDEYKVSLLLRWPDYRIANIIRNRLNERFGKDIANAVSAERIELKIPAKYAEQKQRFISIVKATYIADTPQSLLKQ